MPSKFRKAIGAVKDKTSISLAKVSNNNASNLEVLILKATRHDAAPIDERYVMELFNLISSNRVYAAACAHAIGKRIGKTRNWIVALKSLILVLRIFQDGDPYFPREVLHAMKRGAKILNLSCFRDDSYSNPWDYTAFVRTFALYLEERLDCFLTGKLQKRFTKKETGSSSFRGDRRVNGTVSEMKPVMLIDRISYWQKLLDKAVGTRPTGAAKNNRLVQISLYAIVQESFDLYRDISDGLALLLDSFFHLQYNSCMKAFQTCVKASKQFEDLSSFYDLCKSIGVGRSSEYPSVQKISEELIETLKEFLKDESSFTPTGRSPQNLLPQARNHSPNYGEMFPSFDNSSDQVGRLSESEISQCPSLEDLMSSTDIGTSPPMSMDIFLEKFEKRSLSDDPVTTVESVSAFSNFSAGNSGIDIVSLDDPQPEDQNQEQELGQRTTGLDSITGPREAGGWEDVLFECTSQPMQTIPNAVAGLEPSNANFSIDAGGWEDVLVECTSQPMQALPNEGAGLGPSNANFSIGAGGWEDVLVECTSQPTQMLPNAGAALEPSNANFSVDQDLKILPDGIDHGTPVSNLFEQGSTQEQPYNPFLQDSIELPPIATTTTTITTGIQDEFLLDDVFPVAPTFCATQPDAGTEGLNDEHDLFGPCFTATNSLDDFIGPMDQQTMLLQQQLWVQQQDKILAKKFACPEI